MLACCDALVQALLSSLAVPTLPSPRALLLALALATVPALVEAAPPDDSLHAGESYFAIPPDRELAARDLLEPLLRPRADDLSLRGPSIERDRIKWWLMRGDEARAILLLVPRKIGAPEDPRSTSFAVQIAWAPEVEPEPAELALIDAAIATVQARDQGGFYVLLIDALFKPDKEILLTGPPSRPVAEDPERVRLWWSLKLAAIGLLAGLAAAASLRPRRLSDDQNPSRA